MVQCTFHFTVRAGDGYFGRLEYRDRIVENIEVRDIRHMAHKALATVRKNGNGLMINGAYMPDVFVFVDQDVYHFYIPPTGRTVELHDGEKIVSILV